MEDQLQTSNRSAALCPCQHKVPLIGHKSTSQDPQTAGFPLHLLPVILSSVCEADFPLPGSCWGQQLSFLAKDTSKHTDRGVNSAAHSSPGKPWDGGWIPSGRSTVIPKNRLSHPTDSQQGTNSTPGSRSHCGCRGSQALPWATFPTPGLEVCLIPLSMDVSAESAKQGAFPGASQE